MQRTAASAFAFERSEHARLSGRCARAAVFSCALLLVPGVNAQPVAGEVVYKSKCSACHDSGAGEAPRIAVHADWTQRFAAGRAALHANAIRGIPNTAMAPKGGFAELSDDEVAAAVDYVLARTGFADAAGQAAEARDTLRSSAGSAAPRSDDAVADDVLARRVAEALRDALARRDSAIESVGGELSIRGSGIRLSVERGVVRLTGVAATGATIKQAEEAARSVAGVRRVDNKLIAGGMLDFD